MKIKMLKTNTIYVWLRPTHECVRFLKMFKDSVCFACVGKLFQSTAELYPKLYKYSVFGLGT